MSDLIIAKRYAKALLSIGQDDGKLADYGAELADFAAVASESGEFLPALSNPNFDIDDRRKILGAVISKMGLSAMMNNFLNLLLDKGRIGYVGAISSVYRDLVDEKSGVKRATVTSAVSLDDATVARIKDALNKAVDGEVELELEVDGSLVGGLVARVGDLVYDGSVRTQLLGLKESLKRGELV